MRLILELLARSSAALAACPYLTGEVPAGHPHLKRDADLEARQAAPSSVPPGEQSTVDFLNQFTINDTNQILTSDVGGPVSDQNSLKAGQRGLTLLEDFIFRQKIQHFDHERVSPLGLRRQMRRLDIGARKLMLETSLCRYRNVLSMLAARVSHSSFTHLRHAWTYVVPRRTLFSSVLTRHAQGPTGSLPATTIGRISLLLLFSLARER